MRWRSSLQWKVTLALVLVALVPLTVAGLLAFASERSSLRDDALDNVDAVASIQEARVADLVARERDNVALITSRTQLRIALEEWLETRAEAPLEQMRAILDDALSSTSSVEGVAIVAPDGTRVISVGADLSGLLDDPLDGSAGGALGGAGDGTGDEAELVAAVGDAPEGFGIVFAGSLRRGGRRLGTALVTTSAEPLVRLVGDHTGLGDTGETLIARSTPRGGAQFVAPLRFDDGDFSERAVFPGSEPVAILRALEGHEGRLTGTVDYRGEQVYAATRHLPEVGWGVVAKIDRSEALAPVRDLRNRLLALFAGAGVLVLALSWVVGHRLARPIQRLTEAADRIRRGDLDHRVDVRPGDERQQLAAAFNEMTEQLVAANRGLEARVATRTVELEQANADLQQFVYAASHDLREPLRVVAGFASLLDRRHAADLPPEGRELLDHVVEAVERMEHLLEDLVTLSRAQRQDLEIESVALTELVDEVRGDLRVALDDADARLHADGLPTVPGDRRLLRLVLQNLVSNAVKFRDPERAPSVEVRALREADEWVVEIEDDGIGIDPAQERRIFEVFERLHGTDEYPGTGLGLAVVKTCVDRLGGRVGVRNGAERGTCIWFTLPDSRPEGT